MNDAVFIAREHSVKRKYIISSALDFRIQNIFSDFWTKIFVLRVVNDTLRKDPVSIEIPNFIRNAALGNAFLSEAYMVKNKHFHHSTTCN